MNAASDGTPAADSAADSAAAAAPSESKPTRRRGGFAGLIAILVGIVLGALVGVFYGKAMWIAAGGAQKRIERLEQTLAQKEQFLLAAAQDEADARAADNAAARRDARARQRKLTLHGFVLRDDIDALRATLRAHQRRLGQGETVAQGQARVAQQRAALEAERAALRSRVAALSALDQEERAELDRRLRTLGDRASALHDEERALAPPPAAEAGYVAWHETAAVAGELISFVGEMFLQVLKLLVIPLVVTSMIGGITALGDVRKIGRIGGWTLSYYVFTTGVAVALGMALVTLIRPGESVDETYAFVPKNVEAKQQTTILGAMLDVVRGSTNAQGQRDPGGGMFPSNIFEAASQTNVLALIVFSLVFGGALTTLGRAGQPVIEFFHGAGAAVMKMVHLVMFFAPLGIFGLVAHNITKNGGGAAFWDELTRIGWYAGTVALGLALHFGVLMTIVALGSGRNPFAYVGQMARALLTALSTASSNATLPVSMECCEENAGVSNRAASFVLPLGATVNMDGTALYEAVAVIFIAQTLGMDLGAGQFVLIFLTSTLAAIGAAGIPEAGLVTMVIVLQAAGVPLSGIGAILAIDWFLDRLRTTVNVFGDMCGAAVIDRRVVRKE